MKTFLYLLAIPFIGFNLGLITHSPFAVLTSFVIFISLLLPYVGSRLQTFASNHYEFRRVDLRSGFTVHRLGKRSA